MRYARKLILLVAMAVAAMAFAASPASAQVELFQEPANGGDNVHCPALTMEPPANHIPEGGCSIRAVSTQASVLVRHTGISEVPFSRCQNVFEARFNEDGHGYIYNQILDQDNPDCNREPCDEGEEGPNPHRNLAWEARLSETEPGEENLRVTFCLAATSVGTFEGEAGTPCTVDLHVEQTGHDIEVSTPPFASDFEGGAPCVNLGGIVELSGHWVNAPSPAHPDTIEIVHL